MHPALLIPEILAIIFKFVTDKSGKPLLPSLAALARTCRLFQCQVEGIIWYKIPNVATLYDILPRQVQTRSFRSWSLNRRILSSSNWRRFMECASRVRVLTENTGIVTGDFSIFLAMAAMREPVLLTPNLDKLEWQSHQHHAAPLGRSAICINLFMGPSLRSLEMDAKLLINNIIRLPLSDICPKLEHLKITGNARSAAHAISSSLCGLHSLETVTCSTLDNDAFLHLAQLKRLSYLAVDMRWSVLNLDVLRDRLPPHSFQGLQTLHWKDYGLDMLPDIFLMPDISPSAVHLEIESFCTSSSLRTFLHAFVERFPNTRHFSLVHDVRAGRRFGLQVRPPGREHQLNAHDLKPLFALTSLRTLHLADLGDLELDDDLVKLIASAFPELEQLHLASDAIEVPRACVTFDGLLALLARCPALHAVGLLIDAEDMLSFWDTTVCHERVTHLRLEGTVLGSQSRRAEVDAMLRRVLPALKTVEESVGGVTRRVRDVGAPDRATVPLPVRGGLLARRRCTRNSSESGTPP